MKRQNHIWSCTLAVVLTSVLCFFARQNHWLTNARFVLHQAMVPARAVLLSIAPGVATEANVAADASELETLQDQLLENEIQRRQLLIRNARLRHELSATQQQLESATTVAAPDLIQFVGLEAQVLSHDGMNKTLRDLIIDRGAESGLRPAQLVLHGSGIVLDKGSNFRLETGLKVASGQAVAGRITKVSRWVSLVQPVTDPEFSAAVQLVKSSAAGESLGARGLLQGAGEEGCVVTGIPYTASVAVGDEVFSADVDGINGPRLYFGTVTKAEFTDGGQWNVAVTPAIGKHFPDRLTVLKPKLNVHTAARATGDSR
jgi:cell shape-determining protein MreC